MMVKVVGLCRSLSFVLALFTLPVCALASQGQRPCPPADERAALERMHRLNSWHAIHEAFKRFGHCDDGAIAQGFSDSIVKRLASRWGQLGVLARLSSSDAAFRAFVLRHIDATADTDDLRRVLANTRKKCGASSRALCRDIRASAESALSEAGNPGSR